MKRVLAVFFVVLLVCLSQGLSVAAQEVIAPIDLGASEGLWSGANAINNLGQVVGYNATCSGPLCWTQASLWENGGVLDLGTLGSTSVAYDINDQSQVVGYSTPDPWAHRAFLWENGRMVDLGIPYTDNFALGINDRSQVVGYGYNIYGEFHAFLWENGITTELGTLGGKSSRAYGINDLGQVVGESDACSEGYCRSQAFLWENNNMIPLGTLGYTSIAQDINDLGQVIGYSYICSGGYCGPRAFLWQNGTIIDLDLPYPNSYAFGINDLGQVVGIGFETYAYFHAFVWEDGRTTELGTLGGDISYARDINNLGQVVGESAPAVGMSSHAVLWMVTPEDQIRAIIEEIAGLVEDGVLNEGQGNALSVKLENILKQLDLSKPKVACNLLGAFTSQVQSFMDEGVLPIEVGQLLLARANTVQSQICQ